MRTKSGVPFNTISEVGRSCTQLPVQITNVSDSVPFLFGNTLGYHSSGQNYSPPWELEAVPEKVCGS